ncbi:MAG TPA: hypothetical protein VNK43_00385 [Gemmatimonadales bacterium]|nr:hypothetical protein [Gemmatimonadales bacterium]
MAVDGHVHFHRVFDRARFLAAAATNLRAALDGTAAAVRGPGLLLLVENPDDDFFDRCRGAAGRNMDGWLVDPTGEACSLALSRERDRLVLVAGRQIATREGLEVLAVGTLKRFPRDLPFRAAVDAALEAAGIAIVPWGFGKWTRFRGALVGELVASADPSRVFLGDNGGRPAAGPEPRLFAEARARGIRILPGSDPLPFHREATKVGRYGFYLDLEPGPAPAAALKHRLRDPAVRPRPFGRREGLVAFLRAQTAMQLRKRAGSGR